MGKSIPMDIGERRFPSKGEAREFFRTILYRYRLGERVSEADAADLSNLLQLHTESEQKFGGGIDHFEIMDGGYGTRCFKLVRTDGSSDDFSFGHCITPKTT